MWRLAFIIGFNFGFGLLGISSARAQTAPQAPITPQLPSPPVAQPSPTVFVKPSSPRAIVPATPKLKVAVEEPEQVKVIRQYRGEGYFDAGLAEKLRPILTKAFDIAPASGSNRGDSLPTPDDLLRSILGRSKAADKNVDPNNLSKTSQ
jgi:hypothetical protein